MPDKKALSLLNQIKGKPDKDITIYRAVEKGEREEFNPWDWVAITKEYAKEHWEWPLKWNYKIVEKTVKGKDIIWNSDSLQEYWYRPNWHTDYNREQLKQIYEQAKWLWKWLKIKK